MTLVGIGPGTAKVTVVATEVAARLVAEAAFVAVTMQVPIVVTERVVPVTTQPAAVPTVAVKVSAPVPDPPAVVRLRGTPK
jgi:hypothetical protein